MGRHEIWLAGYLGSALIGNQSDMVSAFVQFGRQRKSRQNMAAGSPGSEHVMAV